MEITYMKYLILSLLLSLSAIATSSDEYLEINKKASKLFVAQNNFIYDSADKAIIQKVSKTRWSLLKQAKDQNAEVKKLFLDFIKTNKASKEAPDDKKLQYQVILIRNKIDAFLATESSVRTQFSNAYKVYSEGMNYLDQTKIKNFNNEEDKVTYKKLVDQLIEIRSSNTLQDF